MKKAIEGAGYVGSILKWGKEKVSTAAGWFNKADPKTDTLKDNSASLKEMAEGLSKTDPAQAQKLLDMASASEKAAETGNFFSRNWGKLTATVLGTAGATAALKPDEQTGRSWLGEQYERVMTEKEMAEHTADAKARNAGAAEAGDNWAYGLGEALGVNKNVMQDIARTLFIGVISWISELMGGKLDGAVNKMVMQGNGNQAAALFGDHGLPPGISHNGANLKKDTEVPNHNILNVPAGPSQLVPS